MVSSELQLTRARKQQRRRGETKEREQERRLLGVRARQLLEERDHGQVLTKVYSSNLVEDEFSQVETS